MNYYYAEIDMGLWRSIYFKLIKANTLDEAITKAWKRYPKAKEIIIDEPIE